MSEINTDKVLQTDSNYLISMFSSLLSNKLENDDALSINISSPKLSESEISNLCRTSGIIHRCVYEYPEAAANAWIDLNFSGETKAKPLDVLNYLMEIPFFTTLQNQKIGNSARNAFKYASELARKFGSGYIVLGIADGLDLSEPVNLKTIQSVEWMYVYSCFELIFNTNSVEDYFQLYNSGLKVHPSRVLSFYGTRLNTKNEFSNSQYQHDSVINLIFENFTNWIIGGKAIAKLLNSSNMYTLGMDQLSDYVRQDIDNETTTNQDYLRSRAQAIKSGMSAANLLVYDLLNEKLENVTRNFAGTKDSLDALKDLFASASNMPRWKLFNEFGTAGLASSVEAARILQFNWACEVRKYQNSNWLQPLYNLLEICMSAKDLYGSVIDNFSEKSIIFPLDLPFTKQEELEIEKLSAERAKILIDSGIISPLEIRKQYENATFNSNIILDDQLYKTWIDQKNAANNTSRSDLPSNQQP